MKVICENIWQRQQNLDKRRERELNEINVSKLVNKERSKMNEAFDQSQSSEYADEKELTEKEKEEKLNEETEEMADSLRSKTVLEKESKLSPVEKEKIWNNLWTKLHTTESEGGYLRDDWKKRRITNFKQFIDAFKLTIREQGESIIVGTQDFLEPDKRHLEDHWKKWDEIWEKHLEK